MTVVPASARHLPGFSTPAVGFDEPFAMLDACHERVRRTLALLARLRAHVQQHGNDDDARQAAQDVIRYFDQAAPLHHQDEELHVFPLLLDNAPPAVQHLVQQLQQDHVHMAADWAAARVPLQALVQGAHTTGFSGEDAEALDRFAQRYAAHLAAEDNTAYPTAWPLLAPEALAAMGREMAARRGVR